MKEELVGLTSLRGIAALAVVMQHFSATAQQHASVTIPSLVPHGYLAVDFFFVLSGYIMCYTYLDAFQRQGWRAAYLPFLQKRLIRLLPLNAFVVGAILLAGWISLTWLDRNIFYARPLTAGDLLTNFLMLQGLGLGLNINGPAWSVSAEFMAYLSFPLLIAATFHRQARIAIAAGAAALIVLTGVALSNPRLGLTGEWALPGGLRCLSQFTFGMLAYRVSQLPRCAAWLAQDRTAWLSYLACLALLATRIDLLVVLTFPLIVAATALNRRRVGQLLSQPALHYLGVISYSLYLVHNSFRPLALELAQQWHPQPLEKPVALGFALLWSLLMVPVASITYRWIEHPSRTLLRRRATAPAR